MSSKKRPKTSEVADQTKGSTPVRFELTHALHTALAGLRLNHSAKVPYEYFFSCCNRMSKQLFRGMDWGEYFCHDEAVSYHHLGDMSCTNQCISTFSLEKNICKATFNRLSTSAIKVICNSRTTLPTCTVFNAFQRPISIFQYQRLLVSQQMGNICKQDVSIFSFVLLDAVNFLCQQCSRCFWLGNQGLGSLRSSTLWWLVIQDREFDQFWFAQALLCRSGKLYLFLLYATDLLWFDCFLKKFDRCSPKYP